MFGKGGMGNLMKQAQQMQDRMQKLQEEIANMEVTGESGAGLVKITITGSHSIRRVDIDESLMEDEKDMWEDLMAAACNDASSRVEETKKKKNGVCHRWDANATWHENAFLIDPEDVIHENQPYAGTIDGSLTLSSWGWPQVGSAYGFSFVTAR